MKEMRGQMTRRLLIYMTLLGKLSVSCQNKEGVEFDDQIPHDHENRQCFTPKDISPTFSFPLYTLIKQDYSSSSLNFHQIFCPLLLHPPPSSYKENESNPIYLQLGTHQPSFMTRLAYSANYLRVHLARKGEQE